MMVASLFWGFVCVGLIWLALVVLAIAALNFAKWLSQRRW